MAENRMERLAMLFEEATRAAPDERERVVRRVRRDSPTLAEELVELLRSHAAPGFLFEPPTTESTESAAPLFESKRGAYRVREILGEGGMGIVYLAEQVEPLRRTVALKVLKQGLEEGESALRFEMERQALALMDHVNIAEVYEAGSTGDGRPYFAMEYVPGLPITEFCDQKRLSVRQRLELFLDVCAAVEHAHQKGILHRDLKPSNILVRSDQEGPTPKIIDFGIAKPFLYPLVDNTPFTEHGTVLGSARYMSPEQAMMKHQEVDTRTDVYSLNVILYELLTGTLPFEGDPAESLDIVERRRRLQEERPPLLSSRIAPDGWCNPDVLDARATTRNRLAHQLRGDLDWVLTAGLERSPERRYSTVAAFSDDLRRFLHNEAVSVGRPSWWTTTRRALRRRRGLATGAASVLLALMLGVIVSTYLYLDRREVARVASEQRDELLRLSDVTRLEHALRFARELVPAHPDQIPAMEAWLSGEAADLVQRLPIHERRLETVKQLLADSVHDDAGDQTAEIEFQHDLLSRLVTDLRRFAAADPGIGTRANVARRLDVARSLQVRSIDDHRGTWRECIEAIADKQRFPQYEGLRLTPQMGLVPLGVDPESGLWEFADLQTGSIPDRVPGQSLRLEAHHGVILVLVPGGRYALGATNQEAIARRFGRDADPRATDRESPVHWVDLDPFFISKFEMTRGQWRQLTARTARSAPQHASGSLQTSDLLPVDGVPRSEYKWALSLADLVLPTEAQWEYAATAGLGGPWWGALQREDIRRYGNVNDQSAKLQSIGDRVFFEEWNDGYPFAAPVGSFEPNPFGLHDTIGNMWEWCLDRYGSYSQPVVGGNGLRKGGAEGEWVGRGGDYRHYAPGTRSTLRQFFNAGYLDLLTVRPVRVVVPAGSP